MLEQNVLQGAVGIAQPVGEGVGAVEVGVGRVAQRAVGLARVFDAARVEVRGGLVERAFGVTLREVLYDYGGGSASGRPIKAVQVGGPLGAYLPESQFDTPLDYEAFAAIGALVVELLPTRPLSPYPQHLTAPAVVTMHV